MKRTWLILILLSGIFNIATAQNIDSITAKAAGSFMAGGPRVGLSVGIIKGGRVYTYHFGAKEKGKNTLPTGETIYEIGSLTKTFTSRLLAQAVLEKRVKLTDDIRKYLKGNYPNLQFEGKPIQLVHLANLTSGLPDNLPEVMPPSTAADPDAKLFEIQQFHDSYTKAKFLADLHGVKLKRAPGMSPAHSNTAAELMGFLLENIYGMSYDALLQKFVTGPLKMNSTYVTVPASKAGLSAKGYSQTGALMPVIPKDAGSAGVLTSSLNDMVKYLGNQLQEKNKAVLLSHRITWGDADTYGIALNWQTKTNFDGQRMIWGSGGTFGFASYMLFYPERGFGVVLLSNENDNGAENALSGLAHGVYDVVYFTAEERAKAGFGFSRSVNRLLEELNSRGFEHAADVAADLKQKDALFKLTEDELNNFGYSLIGRGWKEKALEIFKLNVALFPKSANTYDSLAETYDALGDKENAVKYYKKVLELDPGSMNAITYLKNAMK